MSANNETPNTIQSPCVRNCCLNEDDICLGCFRSLEEIIDWSSANESTRRQYLQNANARKHSYRID